MTRVRAIGLVVTATAALSLAWVFRPPQLPWQQPLRFSLLSQPVGQLNRDTEVAIHGVRVGKVASLSLHEGQAVVGVEVARGYAHLLHEDTSATIQSHGLLGPKFIDLDGGTVGRLADGAVIPPWRVHVSTDLDQVLAALQPDVRQSLKVLLVELGKGSRGRGSDLNSSFRALGEASQHLVAVTATLRRRDQDLAGVFVAGEDLNRELQDAPIDAQIRDTDRVLSGLAQVSDSIGDGIDHTAAVLRALDLILDGNQKNLAQALAASPDLVVRLRALLVALDELVRGVTPALPFLMTAVMETKSAFSGADANGHFVRVLSLTGPCTLGVNAGCSGYAGPAGPPPTQAAAAGLPRPDASSGLASSPARSLMSDQELLGIFVGGA